MTRSSRCHSIHYTVNNFDFAFSFLYLHYRALLCPTLEAYEVVYSIEEVAGIDF
jgi:hypothetical protein